jgi:hypothetical protein
MMRNVSHVVSDRYCQVVEVVLLQLLLDGLEACCGS